MAEQTFPGTNPSRSTSSDSERQRWGPNRREVLTAGAGLAAAATLGATPLLAQAPRERVAVVGTGVRGTGLWGRSLLESHSDVLEMVGLCDINPGRLEYARGLLGVSCPTYTNIEQMLDTQKPDRLIVTSVDATHDEMITQALERDIHVITEKPLTTDESKCQRILDAVTSSRAKLRVAHNYRYSPHRQRLKELLAEGRIGRVTSVDFHWYLDVYHGASYFRRWHGKERFSGGLFVHKASHHFDLLNWWIGSEPVSVYGSGELEFYGKNNEYRSDKCRSCPHRDKCEFHWDITTSESSMGLYVNNEHHDGYIRDGCVWSEEIDIFDKMGALIRYTNGVQVTYSCTTYSPYEGYRIAFNGTEGRLEAWVKERQPWPTPAREELRLTDNFGETQIIEIPHPEGGHGGADPRMLTHIFREHDDPDPWGQAASPRQGALAVLIGIAARQSARSGEPVRIADLTSLTPA